MTLSVTSRLKVLVVGTLAAVATAPAQEGVAITGGAPDYVSYQGTLYHAADPDIAYDGALDLEFRLYLEETDAIADAVWAERHLGVPVFSGIFNVYLGAGDAVEGVAHEELGEVFQRPVLWLGVKVGLDAEIAPRHRITSVPYAMTATNVDAAIHGVPAGTIMMFAGTTAPEGWVICDGTSYTKADYPALYQVVGGTWGETATTFNVPDLRTRVAVGSGVGIDENTDTRAGATAQLHLRPFGSTTGSENQSLTVQQIPPHRHSYLDKSGSGSTNIVAFAWSAADENHFNDDPFQTGAAGTNAGHNNLQPVTYMHYIIKH